MEGELILIYEGDGGGLLTVEEKEDLVCLEGRRDSLLLEKEETWRLKSRATWLECGDDNTNFFHSYAKGRKATNTIWSLIESVGIEHSSFDEMARIGVDHFKSVFTTPFQASIAEVISVA